MSSLVLGFFGTKQAPRLSNNGRSVYYIDPKLEDLVVQKPDFSPSKTNYRMTSDDFDDLIGKIRLQTSGFFFLIRLLKLCNFIITLGWTIYTSLYFTMFDHPFLFILFAFFLWIFFQIICRILRMKTLKNAKIVIENYLDEANALKYHSRGLHWKITSYAQYLELDLNYSPHTFVIPIRQRYLSDTSKDNQASPSSKITTPLLAGSIMHTPRHSTKSTRSTKKATATKAPFSRSYNNRKSEYEIFVCLGLQEDPKLKRALLIANC